MSSTLAEHHGAAKHQVPGVQIETAPCMSTTTIEAHPTCRLKDGTPGDGKAASLATVCFAPFEIYVTTLLDEVAVHIHAFQARVTMASSENDGLPWDYI